MQTAVDRWSLVKILFNDKIKVRICLHWVKSIPKTFWRRELFSIFSSKLSAEAMNKTKLEYSIRNVQVHDIVPTILPWNLIVFTVIG